MADRCGDRLLKTKFFDLFRTTRFKDAIVNEVISCNGDQIQWSLSLLGSPNDWDFLANLADMEVAFEGNDEIVWPDDPRGSFTITSFCNALRDWRSKAYLKVLFLNTWQPSKEKLQ